MNNGSKRLIFPFMGDFYKSLSKICWPLIRVVAGFNFIPHGIGKLSSGGISTGFTNFISSLGFPAAPVFAWGAAMIEIIAGLLLLIGLFTRLAALSLIILLLFIIFLVHLEHGFFMRNNGYEYHLLWLAVVFAIFIRGGGRYSVDNLLRYEF